VRLLVPSTRFLVDQTVVSDIGSSVSVLLNIALVVAILRSSSESR
jgi:hypothetical protein